MSTRSAIMIKVRPEHIGQTMKFNESKLPVPLQSWGEYEACDDKCKEVKIEHPYLAIYCHSDGYPEGVGKVLKETFPDYDTALNLIIGGDCSFVWYDGVRHYANRSSEEWRYLVPKQGDKPEEIYPYIDSEYCYLITPEDGWKVNDYEGGSVNIGTEEEPKNVPAPIFKEY